MTELFLHYLWKYKLYRFIDLRTIQGESLKVIHPGFPHRNAGPDFQQALIKIGDIIWAGNVEIHLRTSDWIKHKHHHDAKYQSVILHVVYEHDTEIYRTKTESYPTLALKEYIPKTLLEEYRHLSLSENKLPCLSQLTTVSKDRFTSLFSSLLSERLLRKQMMFMNIVKECNNDWQEAFFRFLTTNFGFKTNVAAFEMLGRSLPYHIIRKHSGAKMQVYALLFGQAGMLQEINASDSYYHLLYEEYHYLKHQYRLQPIHIKNWNYLRLRPINFPAIRLSQLSEILANVPELYTRLLETEDIIHIENFFKCIPHSYWETHYHFGKSSFKKSVALGKKSRELLLINVVVPLLFSYSMFWGDEKLKKRALLLLETLPFEENNITRFYRHSGFPSEKASHSQAILTLQDQYCSRKRCLECTIGACIIGQNYLEQ